MEKSYFNIPQIVHIRIKLKPLIVLSMDRIYVDNLLEYLLCFFPIVGIFKKEKVFEVFYILSIESTIKSFNYIRIHMYFLRKYNHITSKTL